MRLPGQNGPSLWPSPERSKHEDGVIGIYVGFLIRFYKGLGIFKWRFILVRLYEGF